MDVKSSSLLCHWLFWLCSSLSSHDFCHKNVINHFINSFWGLVFSILIKIKGTVFLSDDLISVLWIGGVYRRWSTSPKQSCYTNHCDWSISFHFKVFKPSHPMYTGNRNYVLSMPHFYDFFLFQVLISFAMGIVNLLLR